MLFLPETLPLENTGRRIRIDTLGPSGRTDVVLCDLVFQQRVGGLFCEGSATGGGEEGGRRRRDNRLF